MRRRCATGHSRMILGKIRDPYVVAAELKRATTHVEFDVEVYRE